MRFELAAVYRDQLRAIEKVREEQRVVTIDDVDRDVLGFYREGELVEIALLFVRAGKLADVATYSIKQAEIPDEEIVAAFLAQHYGASLGSSPAKEPRSADEAPVSCSFPTRSSCRASPRASTASPSGSPSGPGTRWRSSSRSAGTASTCSRWPTTTRATRSPRSSGAPTTCRSGCATCRSGCGSPSLPRRIECCDISHLGGGDTVGAVVAMIDGELDKKRYRTFNVRGDAVRDQAGQINDDYGAMYEVLARRFRRADRRAAGRRAEAERGAPSAGAERARGAGRRLGRCPISSSSTAGAGSSRWRSPRRTTSGCTSCPSSRSPRSARGRCSKARRARPGGASGAERGAGVVGAERGSKEKLLDRVYLPGQKNPIPLRSSTTSLFLLARLRDEAHRFSNRARMRLGKKRRFASPLDDVKGLGGKAKKALLTHVGNLAAIRAADDATLLAVPGITSRHVRALRAAFPSSA